MAGEYEEGLEVVKRLLRRTPNPLQSYLWVAGFIYTLNGKHEEAEAVLKKMIVHPRPGAFAPSGWCLLIVNQVALGRMDEAEATRVKFLEWRPGFKAEDYAREVKKFHFKDSSFVEGHMKLLRKAGLP